MAHNRPIVSSEANYSQSSFLEIDTTVIHLPDENNADIHIDLQVIDRNVPEHIEITQQQLSRTVAGFLLFSFGVFAVGYLGGKQSVLNERELKSDLIPSAMGAKVLAIGVSSTVPQDIQNKAFSSHQKDAKEYGRFATEAEAVMLCRELQAQGFPVTSIVKESRTSSGARHRWYQVRSVEEVQKIQEEQTGKEERLDND